MDYPNLTYAGITDPTDPSKLITTEETLTRLRNLAFSNNALGANNSPIAFYNTLLQQQNRDEDYYRSLPQNVVANLMASGMSRAAALQAAAGVQPTATQVSPAAPETANLAPLGDLAQSFFGGINTFASLASLPFDNRVKAAQSDFLKVQGSLLESQKEGFALASSAVQSAANNGFDFKGANATSLMQHLESIADNAPLVSAIKSNPYAFSTISRLCSDEYATKAASYDPNLAEARVQQQIALTHLTQNDESQIALNNKLLQNEVYRDNVATALYEQVEYAKANQLVKESEVNVSRLNNVLQNIREFNQYDLELIQFQLQQIRDLQDPEYRQAHIENLINSERWQALQALYAYGSTEIMQNTLTAQKNDPDSMRDLMNASRKYLYGVSLGGYESQQMLQRWLSTGAAAVGAVGGAFLIGSKIFAPKVVATPMLNSFTPSMTRTGYAPYMMQ